MDMVIQHTCMIDLSEVQVNSVLIYNDRTDAVNLNVAELPDIDVSLIDAAAEIVLNGLKNSGCYYIELSGLDRTVIEITCTHIVDVEKISAMLRDYELGYFFERVTNRYEFLNSD